jgi:hypothetical protein
MAVTRDNSLGYHSDGAGDTIYGRPGIGDSIYVQRWQ